MSFQAMAWAVTQKVAHPSDKLILLGLADRHNTEWGCAFPSIAWLCEFSGLNRKTVIASLARLVAGGFITDDGRRTGKTGQVKSYALGCDGPFETVPKVEPLDIKNTVPKQGLLHRKSPTLGRKESQNRDTKPIKEPVNDANASLKSAASKNQNAVLPDWLPREAWDGFVAMRRSIKAPLTPKAQSLAIARLADLARAGHDPGKVLEQSILNSWRGLFELKGNRHERNGSPIQRGRHPALDILAEAEAAGDDADYCGVGPALSAVGW